jgi:hypothetical protein
LNAEWSDLEGVGAAAIVKGIKDDLNLIIVEDVFTSREAGPDFRWIVETDEDGVKIFVIVANIGVGRFRYRLSVMRITLGKAGDLSHLPGNVALRLHGEKVIKRGSR